LWVKKLAYFLPRVSQKRCMDAVSRFLDWLALPGDVRQHRHRPQQESFEISSP
jgi:hypothetical protein